nr:helix-turn-helix domain-containing protein [Mesorhizobium sp. LNHC209A00]
MDLTHEFLATMLGARRPRVTVALQMLERGLIHAKRREITIVDLAGLIKVTGGAYAEEKQSNFVLS